MRSHNVHRLQVTKLALTVMAVLLSGCVSDTLSQQDTQSRVREPVSASYDPAQRAAAVEEIRFKAAQPGSGQLTNAYTDANGPNEPMTPEEQAARIAELEGSAAANSATITDAELEAKQQSIEKLRSRAATHYNSAVNSIRN